MGVRLQSQEPEGKVRFSWSTGGVESSPSFLPIAVIKTVTKKAVQGGKCLFWFVRPDHSASLREIKAGTPAREGYQGRN